jgi:hypothetical protein
VLFDDADDDVIFNVLVILRNQLFPFKSFYNVTVEKKNLDNYMGNVTSDASATLQSFIGESGFDQFIRQVNELPAKLSGLLSPPGTSNSIVSNMSANRQIQERITKEINEEQYKYLLSLPKFYTDILPQIETHLKDMKSTLDAVDFKKSDTDFFNDIRNTATRLGMTPEEISNYYMKKLDTFRHSLNQLDLPEEKKKQFQNIIDTRMTKLALMGGNKLDANANNSVDFSDVEKAFSSGAYQSTNLSRNTATTTTTTTNSGLLSQASNNLVGSGYDSSFGKSKYIYGTQRYSLH